MGSIAELYALIFENAPSNFEPHPVTGCLCEEGWLISYLESEWIRQQATQTRSTLHYTVEPRLSGPPLSGTSIIRHEKSLKKGGERACQQLLPWTQECSSSAHAQTPIFTAVYQLSGWIKAWFISYSIIRTIQLSGMAQEQRCPDNRGSTVSS